MHWKKHSPREITAKLSEVRERVANGAALSDAIRSAGISSATYFRWRAQYRNLDSDQVGLIKRLEQENARLKRALQELEVAA